MLSNILDDYMNHVLNILSKIYPKKSKKELKELITPILNIRLKNPTINLDNNVIGENKDTTLVDLCDWIKSDNPVVSGNATFYMQPSIQQSPTSNMLNAMKIGRKKVKNEMFNYPPGSDEYVAKELEQKNLKVILNADYGGSGNKTAAFYNEYGPPATTLMAQSLITTAAAFFESYVGDNQVFFSNSECFDWVNTVIQKDDKIPNWMKIPTPEEVYRRIASHNNLPSIRFCKVLKQLISGYNKDELCYLYYANNIRDFVINHQYIQNLLRNVLTKLPTYEVVETEVPDEFKDRFNEPGEELKDYNDWVCEEIFMNPYKIPKDDMEELISLFTQFIYVDYLTPDSIMKMNNHKRNTDILSDTDSVVVYIDNFISLVLDEIFPNCTFNRKKMYNEFILGNTLTTFFSEGIKRLLDYYGRSHNMDEKSREQLSMKNELYFRVLFLMKVKKRYVASIALREGHIMLPFKIEIKGMDFIKAGVTELVSNRFTKILKDNILYPDEIDIHGMNRDLKLFEQEIIDDLKSNSFDQNELYQMFNINKIPIKMDEIIYLFKFNNHKKSISFSELINLTFDPNFDMRYKEVITKDEGARSSAWGQPGYVGTINWNEINSDNKIHSLDRVFIIKLISKDEDAIERIKDKYPEKYKIIKDKIFNSENKLIRNKKFYWIRKNSRLDYTIDRL